MSFTSCAALPTATARPASVITGMSGRASPRNAVAVAGTPALTKTCSKAAILYGCFSDTNSTPISCIRRRSAADSRPVMTPSRKPAVRPRVMPWPSCASNVFISSAEPSGCDRSVTEPSVMVPSTSIRTTWICAARFLREGGIFAERDGKLSSKAANRIADCSTRVDGPGSDELEAPEIVKMDDAEDVARIVYDNDARDAALLHEGECFAGEDARFYCLWIRVQALRGGHAKCCAAVLFHEAAQIAVGENSRERTIGVYDGGHAEFLCGHFVKCLRHRRLRRDFWKRIAGVHHFFDAEQAFAEASGRMECGEIVMAKLATFGQRVS